MKKSCFYVLSLMVFSWVNIIAQTPSPFYYESEQADFLGPEWNIIGNFGNLSGGGVDIGIPNFKSLFYNGPGGVMVYDDYTMTSGTVPGDSAVFLNYGCVYVRNSFTGTGGGTAPKRVVAGYESGPSDAVTDDYFGQFLIKDGATFDVPLSSEIVFSNPNGLAAVSGVSGAGYIYLGTPFTDAQNTIENLATRDNVAFRGLNYKWDPVTVSWDFMDNSAQIQRGNMVLIFAGGTSGVYQNGFTDLGDDTDEYYTGSISGASVTRDLVRGNAATKNARFGQVRTEFMGATSTPATQSGYNMFANPFATYLDLCDVYSDNSANITPQFFIPYNYLQNEGNQAQFESFNASAGDACNDQLRNDSGDSDATWLSGDQLGRFVPPFGVFSVKALEPAGGFDDSSVPFNINNSAQQLLYNSGSLQGRIVDLEAPYNVGPNSSNNNDLKSSLMNFYNNDSLLNPNLDNGRVEITVLVDKNDDDFPHFDRTKIRFAKGGLSDYQQSYDGVKYGVYPDNNKKPVIYTTDVSNISYAFNTVPRNIGESVDLLLCKGQLTNVSLKIFASNVTDTDVYLEDKVKNEIYVINDIQNIINIPLEDSDTWVNDRFTVHYGYPNSEELVVEDYDAEKDGYSTKRDNFIRLYLPKSQWENSSNINVELYSINGSLLSSLSFDKSKYQIVDRQDISYILLKFNEVSTLQNDGNIIIKATSNDNIFESIITND